MRTLCRLFALFFFFSYHSRADEPIMNMMPRWSGGWGYEFHYEYRTEDDLLMGSEALHKGFKEEVEVFHMDWVYTWKKEVRITVKLPYVINAEREMPDGSGGKSIQKDDGFGDLRSFALKRYQSDGKSGSGRLNSCFVFPFRKRMNTIFITKSSRWNRGGYEAETADFFFGWPGGWVFDGGRPAELHTTLTLDTTTRPKKPMDRSLKPISTTRTTNQRLSYRTRFLL